MTSSPQSEPSGLSAPLLWLAFRCFLFRGLTFRFATEASLPRDFLSWLHSFGSCSGGFPFGIPSSDLPLELLGFESSSASAVSLAVSQLSPDCYSAWSTAYALAPVRLPSNSLGPGAPSNLSTSSPFLSVSSDPSSHLLMAVILR
jgi:hypothetical protein